MEMPIGPSLFGAGLDTPITGQGSGLGGSRNEQLAARQLAQDKRSSSGTGGAAQSFGSPIDSDRLMAAGSSAQAGIGEKGQDEKGEGKEDAEAVAEPGRPVMSANAGKKEASLREGKMASKKAAKDALSKQASGKLKINGFKIWTARLLFEDWKLVIESGGISAPLLWLHVNLHWLGLIIFGPDLLCRIAEEFVLGLPNVGSKIAEAEKDPKAAEKLQALMDKIVQGPGLVEKAIIIAANIVVFCALVLGIIMFILVNAWWITPALAGLKVLDWFGGLFQ